MHGIIISQATNKILRLVDCQAECLHLQALEGEELIELPPGHPLTGGEATTHFKVITGANGKKVLERKTDKEILREAAEAKRAESERAKEMNRQAMAPLLAEINFLRARLSLPPITELGESRE